MKETHIGFELALLRKGKINQADLAEKLQVDQSSVSRLEGDPKPSVEDTKRYLTAFNEDLAAKELGEYLASEWPHLGKPAFRHPYRHEIWLAESAIAKLHNFIADSASPIELVQQGKQYEAGLREASAYLADLKHNFAFVGNISVGKTTALCFVTNLLIEEGKNLKQRVALDTGAGWTTQSEVRVCALDSGLEESGRFGIVVYPHPQEEVFRLASDICASLLAIRDGKESESRVAEEVEKVLRSMAELPRRTSKGPDGGLDDPLLDLAKSYETVEKLTAEFQSRMKLAERTRTGLWFDAPGTQEGLVWLREEFRKINNGRNPKVSLAKRIDVFVPMPLIMDCLYDLTCIDTKGADETAIRPDLQVYLNDERTVTVLCSHFAPDATMIDVLNHLTATGKSGAISERIIFMVLARQDEALSMNSEDDTPIEKVEEAYALRAAQIRSKLAKFPGGKDVPIVFYDAAEENPTSVRKWLLQKLDALRAVHAARLNEIVSATDDLVAKHQEQQVRAAFRKLRAELRQFVETHHQLPDRTIPVHSRLLDALRSRHPRTVWASARRNGDWDNLDSYEHIATAANMDAKTRSDPARAAMEALVSQLSADPEFAAIGSHLSVLKKDAVAWHLKFLDEVKNRSQEIFRAVLFPDNPLWDACEDFWGKGQGFRDRVAGTVQDWLKLPKHEWIQEAVEGIVRKDWQDFFIAPIQEQCKEPDAASPPASSKP